MTFLFDRTKLQHMIATAYRHGIISERRKSRVCASVNGSYEDRKLSRQYAKTVLDTLEKRFRKSTRED